MRKAVVTMAAVLMAGSVAESKTIPKGTVELGGAVSASGGETRIDPDSGDEITVRSVGINGSVLYYAVDNIGFGLIVGYSASTTESDGDEAVSRSGLIGGVGAYNLSLAESVSLVAQIMGGTIRSRWEETGEDDLDGTGWFFGGAGALRFFVGDDVSLDVGLRYLRGGITLDDGSRTRDATVADVTGFAGFSVFFGGP